MNSNNSINADQLQRCLNAAHFATLHYATFKQRCNCLVMLDVICIILPKSWRFTCPKVKKS